MKLVLLRHGESEWNEKNLFTGWTDVNLSKKGIIEAKEAGRILKNSGFDFDVCYTSYLKRAINTLNYVLEEMDREWLPVIKTWKLNERHYGKLQGLNKAETSKKYGEEQVQIWRRSYDILPPLLEEDDERNPKKQEQYRNCLMDMLPLGESLKDTLARVVPYFNEYIKKDMKDGKRVIIAAHGNSLRALAQYIEHLSEEEVTKLNIPTGVPLVYNLDENGEFISKEYLGDIDKISRKIQEVANQGHKEIITK